MCDILIPFVLLQNILDKFNPGARQMINAGKAYLKALHSEYRQKSSIKYTCMQEFCNLVACKVNIMQI